jgi:hypothetical protein
MDAKVRRQVATGTGARDFGRSHPVNTPEFILIIGELDELLGKVQSAAARQREGFIDKHSAAVRKRELERRIRGMHLPHIQRAGRSAAPDNPQLMDAFPRKPATTTQAAFRTVAGGMADAAEEHKDVMGKRGMSMDVLDDLKQSLKDYDAATELGNNGRAAHLEASAELRVLGHEIIQRVRLLDAVNQLHFRQDPSVLAAWAAVSKVQATPKSATEDEAGSEPASGGSAGSSDAASGGVRPAA